MQARRTALDASLLSAARAASTPRGTDPSLEAFAIRALAVGQPAGDEPVGLSGPDRTTVKLLVHPAQIEEATGWLETHDAKIESEPTGTTSEPAPASLVATLPIRTLQALDRQAWVLGVEAPRVLFSSMDHARAAATGLDQALELPANSGLTGAGVLVAVIDSGVDWRHRDFRRADGRTRLERFVHAHLTGTPAVSRFDRFDADDIDAALNGSRDIPHGDPNGHGTHCASIAAGNGLAGTGSRYRGVAPEAALMAMRSEPLLDTHTIAGIREAFALAGGRPCVVSLSLGSHLGAHDGTSALENAIASESGPGRIVVAAAGNEGEDGIHWRGELEAGKDLETRFRISDANLQWVDVWYARGDHVDVWVERPDGVRHAPGQGVTATPFGLVEVDLVENRFNRDLNLTVFIQGGRPNDIWRIRTRPSTIVHGEVHAWAGTAELGTSRLLFPGSTEPAYSIGMPATEERCIAVGAFVSRNEYETPHGVETADGVQLGSLASFSSHGPARLGALKPDIAAPGQFITAALAAGSELADEPFWQTRHAPNGNYITIEGTSMATPFVAGIVALLLQREPRLTPEEIQQRLRITARRDADTGRVWNAGFGAGKLDAAALLAFRSP